MSTPDTEALDQRAVARLVADLHIVQQLAALADHLEQTTARVIVLLVILEVLGQIIDALGQDRNLHFGRAGIALLGRIFLDQLFLARGRDRHLVSFQPVSRDFASAGLSRDVVQRGRPEACRISRQWAAYGLFREGNPAESADQPSSSAVGRGAGAAKTRVGFSIPPA